MIAVHFSKDYARTVLDAIQTGKPIPPPNGPGWTGNAMLTLAGILYAGVYSQGPHTYQVAGISAAAQKAMHQEKKEAVEKTLARDIHDGIKFLSNLMFQVIEHDYDERYGPEVQALVYEKEDGHKAVIPAKGFKGHKDIV
jgi:hypothetical protein